MHRRGFTLVEVLIVISMLAVLALIVFMFSRRGMDKAHVAGCSNNLRQIGIALASYQADNRGYPSQNGGIAWDRAILPYSGYTGGRDLTGNAAFTKSSWPELAGTVGTFACPADAKQRSSGSYKRSYAIVPWTTNWSNGTQFRGWKNRPFSKGVPLSVLDEPGRAATVVEWHEGTESIQNSCGSGAHAYHDRGGPDGAGMKVHDRKQNVLFADGHTELLPFMSNADFVKKYWPGELGNVN